MVKSFVLKNLLISHLENKYCVIYLTTKKRILFRVVCSIVFIENHSYRVSSGWYVLDIFKYYNGQFYSIETYRKIINNVYDKRSKDRLHREKISRKIEIILKILGG